MNYIHKYIFKGGDIITAVLKNQLRNEHEVERYLNGRYIGPQQAFVHIFEFDTHQERPSVTRLSVHLPDQQPVYFGEQDSADNLRQAMEKSNSSLLTFFEYNKEHTEYRHLLYQEFPQHLVLKKDEVSKRWYWQPRQRNIDTIGRMISIRLLGLSVTSVSSLLLCEVRRLLSI